VPSSSKPPGRRVWKLNPESGRPVWAVIFLDAELYLERVNAVPILQRLQESNSIPPLTAVFVSNNCAAARHTDYVCDSDYACFLSEDVVPWALNHHPEVDRDRVVIAGVSLSGLAAAHVALTLSSSFVQQYANRPHSGGMVNDFARCCRGRQALDRRSGSVSASRRRSTVSCMHHPACFSSRARLMRANAAACAQSG